LCSDGSTPAQHRRQAQCGMHPRRNSSGPSVMNALLKTLNGGLIVSCQPVDDGPMDRPDIVAALALAARAGGARALRIEGPENVAAVAPVCDLPIVGIWKRDLGDSPVRITPFIDDVKALAAAGARIIAVDATDRARPVPVADLLEAIRA